MSFLRHGQIYQSDGLANRGQRSPAAPAIVSMSLRPAIPWRVGLHQGPVGTPPPLRRLLSMLKEVVVGVNHHLMGESFRAAKWGMKDRRRAGPLTRPEDQHLAAIALAGAPNDPRRGKERK